jgi:HAD superfamily hydrolase (TIGR01509 family)
MQFAAIIFDFDGLILDTESCEYRAWTEVFRRRGVSLALEEWVKCVGGGPQVWSVEAHLESLLAEPVDGRTVDAEARTIRDALLLELTPRPGVIEFLARVERSGRPFGIASSSRHVWVDGHLQNLGWRDRFKVLATRDRAGAPKPNPATYLLAARELGVDPTQCLAIEDSRNGMLAGLAAGMSVLVCPNQVTQGMDFSGALRVVDRLDQF